MNMSRKIAAHLMVFGFVFGSLPTELFGQETDVYPASDPQNRGQWMYNAQVSDEFNQAELDEDRWYVVGKFEQGKPVYKHPDLPQKKVWKGRAPSQFSGRNYRLEDGMLKLEARWEPDFPFSEEINKPVFGEALPYENITTACLIGRRSFQYGYLEIRSKAADTEVSSAFWSMGDNLEIDFFEQFGDGRKKGKTQLDSQLWWSIRDWKQLRGKPSYTERKDLGFRVADDFHTYGIEWDETGMKYHVDGKLFTSVTADEVRAWARKNREVEENYDGWVANRPIHIWLDMETFPWNDVPESKEDLELNSPPGKKQDGVVDFEIDYVRVWQKPANFMKENPPAPQADADEGFLSFEGPIELEGKRENWWIPRDAQDFFSVSTDKASQGKRALKFNSRQALSKKAVAFAPHGSTKLDAGNYTLSMRVWAESGSSINHLRVILDDPWLELKPFNLSKVATGKWVTLKQPLRRRTASGPKDRIRLVVEPQDTDGNGGTLYVDQIEITKN